VRLFDFIKLDVHLYKSINTHIAALDIEKISIAKYDK
jgi:hypothetical protein